MGMAIAAFAVSVVAVVIAVLSAVYTRQQAISVQRLAKIEVERRKAERTPAFVGHIEEVNEGGWYRLVLRLTSAEPLPGVSVEITEGRGVSFMTGQYGVDQSGASPGSAQWNERLAPDSTAVWRVALAEDRASVVRLNVTARVGGDEWPVAVVVPVPPNIASNVH